jgi:phosphatidylglycerol:prolipoprotein diacylglycerol transferase
VSQLRDAIISFPIFGENFSLNPSSYFVLFGRPIYWYGVIIALGFLLAVAYILHRRDDFG